MSEPLYVQGFPPLDRKQDSTFWMDIFLDAQGKTDFDQTHQQILDVMLRMDPSDFTLQTLDGFSRMHAYELTAEPRLLPLPGRAELQALCESNLESLKYMGEEAVRLFAGERSDHGQGPYGNIGQKISADAFLEKFPWFPAESFRPDMSRQEFDDLRDQFTDSLEPEDAALLFDLVGEDPKTQEFDAMHIVTQNWDVYADNYDGALFGEMKMVHCAWVAAHNRDLGTLGDFIRDGSLAWNGLENAPAEIEAIHRRVMAPQP